MCHLPSTAVDLCQACETRIEKLVEEIRPAGAKGIEHLRLMIYMTELFYGEVIARLGLEQRLM